ncbi:MAG: hypothetical protein RR555_05475 [Bacteroidales bacterium]
MEKKLIQLLTRAERSECFTLFRRREIERELLSPDLNARLEVLLDLAAKEDYLNYWDTKRYSEKEGKAVLKAMYARDLF